MRMLPLFFIWSFWIFLGVMLVRRHLNKIKHFPTGSDSSIHHSKDVDSDEVISLSDYAKLRHLEYIRVGAGYGLLRTGRSKLPSFALSGINLSRHIEIQTKEIEKMISFSQDDEICHRNVKQLQLTVSQVGKKVNYYEVDPTEVTVGFLDNLFLVQLTN